MSQLTNLQDPQSQGAIDQQAQNAQYGVAQIPYHVHNGVDSPRIEYAQIDGVSPTSISLGFFGNGIDGAAVINANTTLTRDMFYTTFSVNPTFTLSPNGFRIFASTSIVVQGTITVAGGNGGTGGAGASPSSPGNGAGGTAGSAGVGITTGTIRQPGNGTAGVAGLNGGSLSHANGNVGTSETVGFMANNGSAAGNGGTGAINVGTGASSNAGTAGAAGTITQVTVLGDINSATLMGAYPGRSYGDNPNPGGAAGGGGGAGITAAADSCAGGGGGAGSGAPGGIAWLCSPNITVSGTITANGGNGGVGGQGGNASGATGGGFNYGGGGGGGGAAGNGGAIILIYGTYTNSGSVTAAGGTGGNGGAAGSPNNSVSTAPGTAGSAGHAGQIFQYQVVSIT